MKYFDLHCDTLTELFDRGETLQINTCHVREEYFGKFEEYRQVMAVFSPVGLADWACYSRFFNVLEKAERDGISFTDGKFILSIEDARLLGNDLAKLQEVYDRGVRIITPLWSGRTCIGGAFDTDEGLCPFGFEVVKMSFALGIIPDISHASLKSASQILSLGEEAKKPVIASHSNSYSVHPHLRNLTDEAALRVKNTGGIIGISLYPLHLGFENVDSETVVRHIDRFSELLGEDTLCIGADFDGIDVTPCDIQNQGELYNLGNALVKRGYTSLQIEKIFYRNAFDFFEKNINF